MKINPILSASYRNSLKFNSRSNLSSSNISSELKAAYDEYADSVNKIAKEFGINFKEGNV